MFREKKLSLAWYSPACYYWFFLLPHCEWLEDSNVDFESHRFDVSVCVWRYNIDKPTHVQSLTISFQSSLQGPIYTALPELQSTDAIPIQIIYYNEDQEAFKRHAIIICKGHLQVEEHGANDPALIMTADSVVW